MPEKAQPAAGEPAFAGDALLAPPPADGCAGALEPPVLPALPLAAPLMPPDPLATQ